MINPNRIPEPDSRPHQVVFGQISDMACQSISDCWTSAVIGVCGRVIISILPCIHIVPVKTTVRTCFSQEGYLDPTATRTHSCHGNESIVHPWNTNDAKTCVDAHACRKTSKDCEGKGYPQERRTAGVAASAHDCEIYNRLKTRKGVPRGEVAVACGTTYRTVKSYVLKCLHEQRSPMT